MAKETKVYVGQPKGMSITHLGAFNINGKEISLAEIRKIAQGKQRFLIRLGDSDSQGIIIPIGYDEPQCRSIDEFIADAEQTKAKDPSLSLASNKAIKDAQNAKKEGRNMVFSSICLYSFLNVTYFPLDSELVSMGQDADGIYFNTVSGQKNYALREASLIEECELAEEKALFN